MLLNLRMSICAFNDHTLDFSRTFDRVQHMFYGDQVNDTRKLFFMSWEKYRKNEPLLPLERQIAAVILDHPEYYRVLEADAESQHAYFPELGQTNPFLHMGLHLAVRDQISTDRPKGIHQAYQQLLKAHGDPLFVEHLMMEHLAECLWNAQRNQCVPNEQEYLSSCYYYGARI